MDRQGRVTVPISARRTLRLVGPARLEVELTEDGLILRPAPAVPSEDVWAYTDEHLRRLDRALGDAAEGRTRKLSEDEIERLAVAQA